MPQALASSGAQLGIGSMLLRETVTLFWVEVEEIWVEAAAPVMTRTATNARMMSFMMYLPLKLYLPKKISLDSCDGLTIGWKMT
jgi:hypothetical protein